MGKLGKKIGESRGVEEVSPADENDTCPDGSWAGPLGKPQEVSPAPTPTDLRIEKAYDEAGEHYRNHPHKTVPLLVWADVDEGIAPLVKELNEIPGVRTDASCQGTDKHKPYVMATWNQELDAQLRERYELEYLGEFWGYVREKFAEGGESAESEPNKATIPAQVGELIAPPLRNEPSAISNESSLGELKAALRKMTVEFRKHFREGDHTLHWRDALDSLTEAERVLARVSEGSGA